MAETLAAGGAGVRVALDQRHLGGAQHQPSAEGSLLVITLHVLDQGLISSN
jgi:hypothetical protein